MKILTLIVGLLAALPAFSQSRVYTNADLGRPLSPNRVTVTPEQLASLAVHQFVAPWVDRQWDRVVSSGSSPTSGPFGDYRQDIQPRRLDGSLLTDPPWQSLSYYPGYYPPYVPYAYAYAPYAGHSPARPPTTNHRRTATPPGRR
jgi:hypothetical protein